MKKQTLALLSLFFLLGCSHLPLDQAPHKTSVSLSQANPEPYALRQANDPAVEQAFRHYLRTGKALAVQTDGFEVFAFNAGQQPIIKTRPFEETVISLEVGEKFSTVSSGDPSRWSYTVAVSGSGSSQQQHVLVKPSVADSSTNLVITTDRRLYSLGLISQSTGAPARRVRFWYPEDAVAALATEPKAAESSAEAAPSETLHFRYSLSKSWFTKTPSWKPLRVFDDGTRSYIEFPPSLAQSEMPALFVLHGKAQPSLVNYRSKPPYLIADTLFNKAILVRGLGRQQSKLTLSRV